MILLCVRVPGDVLIWRGVLLQALELTSITTHRWRIWPCSAVTGANLVSGLDWVVSDVAGRLYYSTTNSEVQRETDSVVSLKWNYWFFIQLLEVCYNSVKARTFLIPTPSDFPRPIFWLQRLFLPMASWHHCVSYRRFISLTNASHIPYKYYRRFRLQLRSMLIYGGPFNCNPISRDLGFSR